jgi:tRNA dimethylallyltransferase
MPAAPSSSALRPILIAGPTASGKSALALRFADACNGVVINADSMQVYRDLRILTARPTADDEQRAPHWLYGHVPAREAYSVGRFLADIEPALSRARDEGKRPIIVGGTGLYFKALLEGLAPVPAIPPDIRKHWRQMADEHGAYGLWQMLTECDPEMAFRLDPNDTQRLVRAHEVLSATGRSLADWQRQQASPLIAESEADLYVVEIDRVEVQRRATARFQHMIAEGAVEEVRALSELQLDTALPAMRAIGVRPLLGVVRGERSLDEAATLTVAETVQYIKRQQTWLRRYMITWESITTQ